MVCAAAAAARRWNGQDVAVMIIEHCESSLYAVEHEAALMLSLNHENIVRAYHFVTYMQQPQLLSSCSMGSSQGSRMRAAADKEIAEAAAAAAASPGGGKFSDSSLGKSAAAAASARNSIGECSSRQRLPTPCGPLQGSLGALSSSSRGSGGGGAASRLERATTSSSARPSKAETWLVQEFCDRGTLADVAAGWQPDAECEAQMLERLLLQFDAAK